MRLSSAIWSSMIFQSTLSVRRATMTNRGVVMIDVFQSTLSVRRMGDGGFLDFSIHALRKESDVAVERQAVAARISIHALRKESDEA